LKLVPDSQRIASLSSQQIYTHESQKKYSKQWPRPARTERRKKKRHSPSTYNLDPRKAPSLPSLILKKRREIKSNMAEEPLQTHSFTQIVF
jgi:hypothetical protein